MKNILLIAVGIMLSAVLAGCITTVNTGEKISPIAAISTIKQNGCDSLSEIDRKLMLLVIKSNYPDYPDDGVCDPLLIDSLLSSELEKLQTAEND